MDGGSAKSGQQLVDGDSGGLRHRGGAAAPQTLDEQIRQVDADETHHERGDDLVHPEPGPQVGRQHGPRSTHHQAHHAQSHKTGPPRHRGHDGRAQPGDHGSRQQELAVPAYVPQSGSEGHDVAHADEQQRGKAGEHALPAALTEEAGTEEIAVEREWIATQRQQDDRTCDQSRCHGDRHPTDLPSKPLCKTGPRGPDEFC